MRRLAILSVVTVLLVVPATAGADWLQPRGDAAATGFQPAEGPEWPDVALDVSFPENIQMRPNPDPLIVGDRVLVLTYGNYDAYNGSAQVRSVNLTTGQTSVIGQVDVTGPMTMATDGSTVFVGGLRTVTALPLDEDGESWTWSWEPRTQAERFQIGCRRMTVDHGAVTVLCSEDESFEEEEGPGDFPGGAEAFATGRSVVLVARLDAATGDPLWVREWPNATRNTPDTVSTDEPTKTSSSSTVFPIGLAVANGRVVVETIHFTGSEGAGAIVTAGPQPAGGGAGGGSGHLAVRALDANSGSLVWDEPWRTRSVNITEVFAPVADPSTDDPVTDDPSNLPIGNPVVTEKAVYVKALKVRKLNLGNGELQWNREVGGKDFNQSLGGGTALAYGQGNVFATTAQTVYKIDGENPQQGLSQSLNFTGDQGFDEDPIVTPGNVYATTYRPDGNGSVYAFSTDDGDRRWEHRVDSQNIYSFAVGDGILAYTDVEFFSDGVATDLVVLGQTESSPQPSVSTATRYPDVDQPVRVNLSGSSPGAFGDVTRYKAIWGDGNTTGWQSDPVLNHSYASQGNHTARFVVGNDANQTASTTHTFHVGQEAPTEPNWVEERFQKENQDMTFGVLGLAVALAGGAVGVGRRYRKRSRLEEELDALEEGFEETKDQPSECEAFLDNRKARARSLAVDGYLKEEQVGILENRAEELRGQLRVGALEEEFAFLPYGLVTKARQMVEDGDVTSLEKEAFLQAVEEDEVLTEEQKATVRERIQRWHGRDVGGGAS